jgi:RNA polymerase sigma factor (sigma-70 family)
MGEGAEVTEMSEQDEERARALLESHLDLVRRIVAATSGRKGLGAAEREEFASFVVLKLLENDCARLRCFRGQSSVKTYLTIVIQRLFIDFNRARQGTWRASARARAMGSLAERLERQISRDGLSFEEVLQQLLAEGVEITRDELWRLAESLPRRRRPRLVDLESVPEIPGSRRDPESEAAFGEQSRLRRQLDETLRESIATLPTRDALILKMWFERGMTAPQIAGALRIRTREVYSAIRRSTSRLRKHLERRRVQKREVLELLNEKVPEMDLFAEIR